jgi:hypothetical protein
MARWSKLPNDSKKEAPQVLPYEALFQRFRISPRAARLLVAGNSANLLRGKLAGEI